MRRHPALLLVIVLAASAWPGMRGAAQAPPQAQMPPIGTGLIAGQVIDAQTGKPIPEVMVGLTARVTTPAPATAARGAVPFSITVISDSQGRFFFAKTYGGKSLGHFQFFKVKYPFGQINFFPIKRQVANIEVGVKGRNIISILDGDFIERNSSQV